MKIDKNTINAILKLDDEQLWSVIQLVAKKSGLSIDSKKRPENMDKIRDALSNVSEGDLDKVTELLKRGMGNG